jgi:hypothetical protein
MQGKTNMKKFLFFLVFSQFSTLADAQTIKFLNATEQHWVGGVCCSYGINYDFYFESADTVNFVHIDTVWIGEKFFTEGGKNNLTNFKNVRQHKTTYHISAASIWNTKNDEDLKIVLETSGPRPPHYKGKACLIYCTDRQRKMISVPEFKKLNTVAYP